MRPRRDDRGAGMVEAALVFPLIAMLTFGVIDGGLYFAFRGSVGNATRDGARAISVAGTSPTADYDGLRAMQRSLNGITPGTVQRIVVFEANDYRPDIPLPCKSGYSNPGQNCNVYFPADMARPPSDWENKTWLGPLGWANTERSSSRSLGADLVGVAVTSRMNTPLSVLGGKERTVTRVVVVQVEVNEL